MVACKLREDGIAYKTAEHYMMVGKSKVFKDDAIIAKIITDETPKEAKGSGRQVKNFDKEVWDSALQKFWEQNNTMKDLKHISKFLSLILRHKPEEIGISMDKEGWVDVEELIEKCNLKKHALDFETLEEVVGTNDKQRFAFNDDDTKIRANQGHTVNVDLEFEATKPIEFLYHGNIEKHWQA